MFVVVPNQQGIEDNIIMTLLLLLLSGLVVSFHKKSCHKREDKTLIRKPVGREGRSERNEPNR